MKNYNKYIGSLFGILFLLLISMISVVGTHIPIQLIYEQNFSNNQLYPPTNNGIQNLSIFCGNAYENQFDLISNELKYYGGGDNDGGAYYSIHQNTTNSSFRVWGDYNASWKIPDVSNGNSIVGVCGTDTNLLCVQDDCNLLYTNPSTGLLRVYLSSIDGSTDFTDCNGKTFVANDTIRMERIGNTIYAYINNVQECSKVIAQQKFNLTQFKYFSFADTGSGATASYDNVIFQYVGFTEIPDIAPNISWTDENPPNDFGTNANGTLSYYYNCSDEDTPNVSTHLFIDNIPHQSNYNIPQGTNQTLNVTLSGLSDGSHNINITCDDGELNESVLKTLFIDRIEPDITFNNPNINGTNYEIPFNSNITILDTNLWSTNLTVFNTSGFIQYNNYTEDWNITFLEINDIIDISVYTGGTYDICLEGCDAHTKDKLPDDFNYIVNGQRIDFQDVPILINGNIKEIKLTEIIDRVNIQIDLFQIEEFSITLDQCFKPVSNSNYYGHFVCKEKNLWFDTMPHIPTYIIKDQYNRYEIFISPQEKEIKFESVGVLNCETQCRQITGDADDPQVFLELPENNHITYNESQQFDFNVSHPPPDKIINCSIEIDGIKNNTLLGTPFISTGMTQSITVTNLFDTSINRTLTWTINCTDDNNHISNIAEVRNLQFMTNITVAAIPPITTGEAIENFNERIDILIIFAIWIILFICSIIFHKWGVFAVLTFILGMLIAITYDFNGNGNIKVIFGLFNLIYLVAVGLSYTLTPNQEK